MYVSVCLYIIFPLCSSIKSINSVKSSECFVASTIKFYIRVLLQHTMSVQYRSIQFKLADRQDIRKAHYKRLEFKHHNMTLLIIRMKLYLWECLWIKYKINKSNVCRHDVLCRAIFHIVRGWQAHHHEGFGERLHSHSFFAWCSVGQITHHFCHKHLRAA